MTKNYPPEFVSSVSEYVSAFQKIEQQITDNQCRMLVEHYNFHSHITTATDLALTVGYNSFSAANGQYGKLGSMVSNALGLGSLGVITLVLMAPPSEASNAEWLWVMRENVAKAIEKLGWVKKTSSLFYPNGMVGRNFNHQT